MHGVIADHGRLCAKFRDSPLGPLVNYEEIEFGDVIGRGSFAVVHKGKVNGAAVALKRLRIPVGDDVQQLLIESKEIAALRYIFACILYFCMWSFEEHAMIFLHA